MKIEKIILDQININEKIARYKELEIVLNKNKDIARKLGELKLIQKQLVHAEKLEKKDSQKKLKNDFDNKIKELEEYPLMGEYMELQEEINIFLQNFKEIIENGIDEDLSNL